MTVTLHELAHAVAGLALGLVPTLHASFVTYDPEPTDADQVVTAAAGPLFSLVLGVVVHLATRSAGRGPGRLVWMWAGLLPLQNFAGYLVIAPFARRGRHGSGPRAAGRPGPRSTSSPSCSASPSRC